MAKGPRDTMSLVMLTGWDATALQNWQLQDGTSIADVTARLNGALGALNAEFSSGLWASLVSFTDRPDTEYRVGASNGMQLHTEYGRPDAARAETEGHMLPYQKFDRALGWTWDYLEDARMEQLEADIADAIKDVRDTYRQKILRRLLKRGDDSGVNQGLGSGGLSPGFATAASATGVDFTPPTYGGVAFDANHEHYVGIAGGAFTAAVFQTARTTLREHGHEPPYEFIIGPTDETTVKGLSGFVRADASWVAPGALQDRVIFQDAEISPGVYPIGAIDDFRIWVVSGVPQYYGFGWKSYGGLSQRNPLRIRLAKGLTRPAAMAASDPRNGSPAHPLQYMMLRFNFGVGVGDRTNGTARYVNNATWADGTPT